MCAGNVEASTRKKVLSAIHDAALSKAKHGYSTQMARDNIMRLIIEWIDELAEKHEPCKCSKCGHGFI